MTPAAVVIFLVSALTALFLSSHIPAHAAEHSKLDVVAVEGDRITLNVVDTDIVKLLRLLATSRRVNIVAGKDVTGPISISLFEVTFEQALDAIMLASGYTYAVKGNLIHVKSTPEEPTPEAPDLILRRFKLDYTDPAEVSKLIQAFFGDEMKIVLSQATKSVIIEGTPQRLKRVEELVQDLDTPPKQVLIEAHIMEVRSGDDASLGIDWNLVLNRNPLSLIQNPAERSAGLQALGGPLASGIFFGFVDTDFRSFLSVLRDQSKLNTLARPKVLVLDNQPAEILIGSKLGFRIVTTTQTSTQESIEFLKVGVQLSITPQIKEDGNIILTVYPKVSDGQVVGGLPSETSAEVSTTLLVKDGETIVIGGLLQERDELITRKVPFLGSIPIFGHLFKRTASTKAQSELIILIQPHIVPSFTVDLMDDDIDMVQGHRKRSLGYKVFKP